MDIEKIIDLLKFQDFFGVCEEIDVAKGKYLYTKNIKKVIDQEKRKYYLKKKLKNG